MEQSSKLPSGDFPFLRASGTNMRNRFMNTRLSQHLLRQPHTYFKICHPILDENKAEELMPMIVFICPSVNNTYS